MLDSWGGQFGEIFSLKVTVLARVQLWFVGQVTSQYSSCSVKVYCPHTLVVTP